jgi:L-alanine-DL-glutamate epimerase-like enolase superfamily enzyme
VECDWQTVTQSDVAMRGIISRRASIKRIEVSAYTVPTDMPESDGTLSWNSTTIVLVSVSAENQIGLGYTYADIATASLIHDLLAKEIEGRDAMAIEANWEAMVRRTRNLGRSGIVSMALSAVDAALWDLKARILQLPLITLLGSVRKAIPIYGSGGFISYTNQQLEEQLGGWASAGISQVKMKIGCDAKADRERVHLARCAIGPDTALFVDANGAYDRKQALAQAESFLPFHVTWFEEPVSSDDLEGLRFIRDRAPAEMEIAAGEYGYDADYFRRMLEAGAVDVLQADATRCGGITGFRQVAALCSAHHVQLSAHTAPALHTHVCCASLPVRHLEYFHDHVRIEKIFFDGVPEPVDGALYPDLTRSGMGIELKKKDVERFAA